MFSLLSLSALYIAAVNTVCMSLCYVTMSLVTYTHGHFRECSVHVVRCIYYCFERCRIDVCTVIKFWLHSTHCSRSRLAKALA